MTELTVPQPSELVMTPSFHAVAVNATDMAEAHKSYHWEGCDKA